MEENEKQGIDSMSFKLSPAEKQKITSEANSLNISLSEYIRIKALMDENDVITVKEENRKLKKELTELKVKNSFYKNTERHTEGILIKVSEEDKELLNNVLNLENFLKVTSKNIEGKIVYFIMQAIHDLHDKVGDELIDEDGEEYTIDIIEAAGYDVDLRKIFIKYKEEVFGL